LSNWAFERAKEEADHDRLALLDIKSLGYRAEELVEAITPSVATTLLDYFQRSVNDSDPIDCVGYIHATERLSHKERKQHIRAIDDLLPENINATRCLRVRNHCGNDADKVIRACYETSLLLFSLPRAGYLLEAELEEILKPFKLVE